jgi:hypothetical protein
VPIIILKQRKKRKGKKMDLKKIAMTMEMKEALERRATRDYKIDLLKIKVDNLFSEKSFASFVKEIHEIRIMIDEL